MMDFLEKLNAIKIGDFSLSSLITAALILLIGAGIVKLLMKVFNRIITRPSIPKTLHGFLYTGIKVALYVLLVLVAMDSLGIPITTLVAIVSVAGVAVSLALQDSFSNIASGFFLLVNKPFEVGDFVEADGVSGTVTDIGFSYTRLTTGDNKYIFIPNKQIFANKIINYTYQETRRVDIVITASYDAPTAAVKKALTEAYESVPGILENPAPFIGLKNFGASSIEYNLRVWVNADDYWRVFFALNENIREAFAANGVEMTYDHLNVHVVEDKTK